MGVINGGPVSWIKNLIAQWPQMFILEAFNGHDDIFIGMKDFTAGRRKMTYKHCTDGHSKCRTTFGLTNMTCLGRSLLRVIIPATLLK